MPIGGVGILWSLAITPRQEVNGWPEGMQPPTEWCQSQLSVRAAY